MQPCCWQTSWIIVTLFQNYMFAGAQYGANCWCADTYGAYGLSTACTITCASGEICGGNQANSIEHTGWCKYHFEYFGTYSLSASVVQCVESLPTRIYRITPNHRINPAPSDELQMTRGVFSNPSKRSPDPRDYSQRFRSFIFYCFCQLLLATCFVYINFCSIVSYCYQWRPSRGMFYVYHEYSL